MNKLIIIIGFIKPFMKTRGEGNERRGTCPGRQISSYSHKIKIRGFYFSLSKMYLFFFQFWLFSQYNQLML